MQGCDVSMQFMRLHCALAVVGRLNWAICLRRYCFNTLAARLDQYLDTGTGEPCYPSPVAPVSAVPRCLLRSADE